MMNRKMRLVVLTAILLSVCYLSPVFGQPGTGNNIEGVVRAFTPVNLDSAATPAYNFQQANRLPLTGYFEKSFAVGDNIRTAKFYIATGAPVRSFFTVVAVPGHMETTDFLVDSGWLDLADDREEGLVLLEQGESGWGTAREEQAYINAVMDFYGSNPYFSIFGISYLVGYDGGGSALESWAAANPLKTISQAYVNSGPLPDAFYSEVGSVTLDGLSSGYTPVTIPDDLKIAKRDVPVPTAFVNTDLNRLSRNIDYWKGANDVVVESSKNRSYFYGGDVFNQSEESDAWATEYTGSISKVVTLQRQVDVMSPQLTQTLYDFVTEYVSYDNTTAYGNHLAPRKAFGEIRTMLVNGELREFQVYVPESAAQLWPEGAPVVFVFAGNSQTDQVFFHNTLWWKVADKEGFLLAIPCETYSSSSTSVSHADTDLFYEKLADYMTNYFDVDPTRFYATGQSAGSFASQGFGITNPEFFAAIASTSGLSAPSEGRGFGRTSMEEATFGMIPIYAIVGEGDIGSMTGTLWDDTQNTLDDWAAYYLEANGLGELGDGTNRKTEGRFTTWTWTNDQGFPLFKVGRTLYRAHNSIPAEMPLLWDFLKHWSYKEGIRYYDGDPLK